MVNVQTGHVTVAWPIVAISRPANINIFMELIDSCRRPQKAINQLISVSSRDRQLVRAAYVRQVHVDELVRISEKEELIKSIRTSPASSDSWAVLISCHVT